MDKPRTFAGGATPARSANARMTSSAEPRTKMVGYRRRVIGSATCVVDYGAVDLVLVECAPTTQPRSGFCSRIWPAR